MTKNIFTIACCGLVALSLSLSVNARSPHKKEQNFQRGNGQFSSDSTYATRRGDVRKSSNAKIDRVAGTATSNKTMTAADGRVTSKNKTWNKTDNGFTQNSSVTGLNGKTYGKDNVVQRTENGFTQQKSTTLANGTTSGSANSVTRTDSGFNQSKSFQTSNGKNVNSNTQFNRTENGSSFNKQVTNANGDVVGSKQQSIAKTDSGYEKSTTLVNKDGESKTFTRSSSNN